MTPRPTNLPDAWLLFRVVGVITLLRVVLPRAPLPALVGRLAPRRVPPAARADRLAVAERYTDSLLQRIRFPQPGTCLPRALTLYYLASRYGFPVEFHCGVRRVDEGLKGHAWLTLEGAPFLEQGDPSLQFTVTFSSTGTPTAG